MITRWIEGSSEALGVVISNRHKLIPQEDEKKILQRRAQGFWVPESPVASSLSEVRSFVGLGAWASQNTPQVKANSQPRTDFLYAMVSIFQFTAENWNGPEVSRPVCLLRIFRSLILYFKLPFMGWDHSVLVMWYLTSRYITLKMVCSAGMSLSSGMSQTLSWMLHYNVSMEMNDLDQWWSMGTRRSLLRYCFLTISTIYPSSSWMHPWELLKGSGVIWSDGLEVVAPEFSSTFFFFQIGTPMPFVSIFTLIEV